MEPAKAFVLAMGERLRRLTPGIKAEPRTNGSLFRIYRDTRFSPDKSPYKTNLGDLLLGGRRAAPGLPGLLFSSRAAQPDARAAGCTFFPDRCSSATAAPWPTRNTAPSWPSIMQKRSGRRPELHPGRRALQARAGRVRRRPGRRRVPAAPRRPLRRLRRSASPSSFTPPPCSIICFDKFKPMEPLHRWLAKLVKESSSFKTMLSSMFEVRCSTLKNKK
ncbi:MAG: DUF2461 domain-containing protein [Marinilabiliales bacterium]|nr:DUF2461 domain-containing protein [Marinilabiliales bacterium]